jgi:hypothetical protein
MTPLHIIRLYPVAAALLLTISARPLCADPPRQGMMDDQNIPRSSPPVSDIPPTPDPEPEPGLRPHPDPDLALQPQEPRAVPDSSTLTPHAAEPGLPPPPMPQPAEPGLPPPPMPEPAEPPPLATNPELPSPPPLPPADPTKESDKI